MTTFARPGQAQPKQQSQGSPYNPQGGGGFQAWNPQNFQKAMQPGGNTYSAGMNESQRSQAQTAWAQPKQQLLEWGAQAPQPGAMQGMPAMNQFGQLPNQNLNSIMQQRQALVQQINNAQSQQQVGTWLGEGAPPDNWGQMQFNPQQMWQNANQMVNQGWQNPLSQPGFAQPSQPPSFGTPYNPQGGQPADPDWITQNEERLGRTWAMRARQNAARGHTMYIPPESEFPGRKPSQKPGQAAPRPQADSDWLPRPTVDADGWPITHQAVMVPWYNERTGETTDRTAGVTPRPGSGWVAGSGPSQPQQRTPPSPTQPRPSAPSQYDDLFKQFGFSPPPGFMDALIGRLQGGRQGGPQFPSLPQPPPGSVRAMTQAVGEDENGRFPGDLSYRPPEPPGYKTTMAMIPSEMGDPGPQQPSPPGFPQPPGGQPTLPGFRSPGYPPGGPMPGWPQWPQLPNVGGYPPPPPNRNAPRPIG